MGHTRLAIGTALLQMPLFTRSFMRTRVSAFDSTLFDVAASMRSKISRDFPSPENLFFPSAYVQSSVKGIKDQNDDCILRGFCNWIIPGRLMVGQYPGQNPEVDGPSAVEVEMHLSTLLNDAGVTMFVSLQSEIPPQDDYQRWNQHNGEFYLPELASRLEFPRPFTHYAPVVESILLSSSSSSSSATRSL
jgi:hypothetical protein